VLLHVKVSQCRVYQQSSRHGASEVWHLFLCDPLAAKEQDSIQLQLHTALLKHRGD
jgi:hypothetical protein